MGNLSTHKLKGVRKLIEARAASLLYLPPPDLARGRPYSPTSTRSRWSSQSSRPGSEMPPDEPKRRCAKGSDNCRKPLPQKRDQTTSTMLDMFEPEGSLL